MSIANKLHAPAIAYGVGIDLVASIGTSVLGGILVGLSGENPATPEELEKAMRQYMGPLLVLGVGVGTLAGAITGRVATRAGGAALRHATLAGAIATAVSAGILFASGGPRSGIDLVGVFLTLPTFWLGAWVAPVEETSSVSRPRASGK